MEREPISGREQTPGERLPNFTTRNDQNGYAPGGMMEQPDGGRNTQSAKRPSVNDSRPRRNCNGTLKTPGESSDINGSRPTGDEQSGVSDRRPSTPQTMPSAGRLIFQVTTARGAIPLEGAQVTVRDFTAEGESTKGGDTLAVMYSGADGKTEPLVLPAPSKSSSLEAAAPGAPLPYALYNAEVVLDSYYVQNYSRIPLFDGITSVQQADLIPLPENGTENGLTSDDNRFTEGQNPDL